MFPGSLVTCLIVWLIYTMINDVIPATTATTFYSVLSKILLQQIGEGGARQTIVFFERKMANNGSGNNKTRSHADDRLDKGDG